VSIDIITTVIEPAETYDLVSLSDVKTELGITGTTDDAWLSSVIERASAAAAQYCNRVFAAETVKDEFWPQRDGYPWIIPGGIAPLQLTRWPVSAVDSVLENSVALSAPSDYRVDAAPGRLIRIGGEGYPRKWPAWPISVQYIAGFATIPYDIQDAVVRMVKSRWFQRKRDPLLRQEDIPGVYSATYWVDASSSSGAITPDISDLLDNYRSPVVTT